MAEHEWTAESVADHFDEAFRTLRRLPPVRVQGYFNAWPEVLRSSHEIAAMAPDEAERGLVWSRAARVPWKQISGELGCDRTTARPHGVAGSLRSPRSRRG
jgi:hypothetical protein